jgi:hypothetical protein
VLRNDLGIVFPATAQNETLRFWLPFTETDGPFSNGHDVLNQCVSMSFGGDGGCCTCTNLGNGRYGNAGVVDMSSDFQDVGMWLPHVPRIGQFSVAIIFQAPGPGDAYLSGGDQVSATTGMGWLMSNDVVFFLVEGDFFRALFFLFFVVVVVVVVVVGVVVVLEGQFYSQIHVSSSFLYLCRRFR